MSSKVYRHYGANHFDPTHKLGGGHMGKPNGLWASPKKPHKEVYTWEQWCRNEDFHLEKLNHFFDFRLKKGTKILRIHNLSDIIPYLKEREDYKEYSELFPSLVAADPTRYKKLDMEKIHTNFDGMEVYMGQNWCELHDSEMFYPWDVDSLVLWNLDRVITI